MCVVCQSFKNERDISSVANFAKKNFLYIAVQFGVVSLGCIKVINVMVICISRNTWLELNGEYLGIIYIASCYNSAS
jgi:hypothetical protein